MTNRKKHIHDLAVEVIQLEMEIVEREAELEELRMDLEFTIDRLDELKKEEKQAVHDRWLEGKKLGPLRLVKDNKQGKATLKK